MTPGRTTRQRLVVPAAGARAPLRASPVRAAPAAAVVAAPSHGGLRRLLATRLQRPIAVPAACDGGRLVDGLRGEARVRPDARHEGQVLDALGEQPRARVDLLRHEAADVDRRLPRLTPQGGQVATAIAVQLAHPLAEQARRGAPRLNSVTPSPLASACSTTWRPR
jgi:hypothetical protein